jgi:hypothetical protein
MRLRPNRKVTAWLLIGSIALLPAQQVVAANPAGSRQPEQTKTLPVRDVSLQAGGVLRGQVMNKQGKPCTGVALEVIKISATNEKPLACQTDGQGRFELAGLSAGVYQVATAEGGTLCRLWAPTSAPPSAVPAALVVQGEGPVRGSLGALGSIGPLGWTLIGLGVAAAIAIPLVLANDDDDDAS